MDNWKCYLEKHLKEKSAIVLYVFKKALQRVTFWGPKEIWFCSGIESGTRLEGIDTAYLVCFINIWEVSSLLHSVQHRKLDATTIFLKTIGAIDQYMKSTSVSVHFDGNVEQTVMMCGRLQVRPLKRNKPCTSLLTHSLVLRFIWLGGTMEKWVGVSPSLMIRCWIFNRKRSYDPCSEPHHLLSAPFQLFLTASAAMQIPIIIS